MNEKNVFVMKWSSFIAKKRKNFAWIYSYISQFRIFTFVLVYFSGSAVRIAQSIVSFNAILVFCLRERDRHVIN